MTCASTHADNDVALFGKMKNLAQHGSPEAQYHLGMFYNNGIGTQKDTARALKWFEKSAMGGDPLGNYKLGCYYDGQGQSILKIDKQKALEHKLIAAQQGYMFAQYDVAVSYYDSGEIEKALKWWKASADQGDPESIYTLYTIYAKGEKLPKDNVLAYGYLKIIERNTRNAQRAAIEKKLIVLEKDMTTEQRDKALAFVNNWTPRRSPLTVKALNGLEESKKIVENTSINNDLQ